MYELAHGIAKYLHDAFQLLRQIAAAAGVVYKPTYDAMVMSGNSAFGPSDTHMVVQALACRPDLQD
eukprot:6787443-Pyramimonas_sp.AAC.1